MCTLRMNAAKRLSLVRTLRTLTRELYTVTVLQSRNGYWINVEITLWKVKSEKNVYWSNVQCWTLIKRTFSALQVACTTHTCRHYNASKCKGKKQVSEQVLRIVGMY